MMPLQNVCVANNRRCSKLNSGKIKAICYIYEVANLAQSSINFTSKSRDTTYDLQEKYNVQDLKILRQRDFTSRIRM